MSHQDELQAIHDNFKRSVSNAKAILQFTGFKSALFIILMLKNAVGLTAGRFFSGFMYAAVGSYVD